MTTIDLVYFNAGGGHRAAAQALQQVIRDQRRPWNVRKVNLTEVLDPQGRFRRVTGMEPEDLYNKRLATRLDAGPGAGAQAAAGPDPAGARAAGAALAAALAAHAARSGRVADPQLQPRAARQPGAGACPACPSSRC